MYVPKNYSINAEVSLPSKETAHAALCHLGCVPMLRGLLVHEGKAGAGDALGMLAVEDGWNKKNGGEEMGRKKRAEKGRGGNPPERRQYWQRLSVHC